MTHDKATERELAEALVELARWSEVATRNGELHARIASALALAELGAGSSAAVVDGAEQVFGHHETVGERQGRQPVPDKATELAATVRGALDKLPKNWEHMTTEEHAVLNAARVHLDALEALATGRATGGRTEAAAVDQAIAWMRAKGWVHGRVLADAVEELRDERDSWKRVAREYESALSDRGML